MRPSATALQRLVAQPVSPLVVAVFPTQRFVVIAVFIDMADKVLHGIPVLFNNDAVAELLPHRPGHDDTCIRPAQTHHPRITILSPRSHPWEASFRTLGVAHIAHPFMEEAVGVGEESTRLCEHLSICCPALPFVTLRTIGGHREIIRAHAPQDIGQQTIDAFIARRN